MGVGAYGTVICVLNKEDNKKYAIKKISNVFEDLIDAKRIYREVKLLNFLNHPNIIKLVDIIYPESKEFNDLYIVTDTMDTDL